MEHCTTTIREPWHKGKLVGQKAPLKLKEIWPIRVRLQLANRSRELALFNLGIDSKLRACDLVKLQVRDVCHAGRMASRAIVLQQKTRRPVQFEITEPTRDAVGAWIRYAGLTTEDALFPSRMSKSAHLSTRQYARIVDSRIEQLGLDRADYGTHTLRRTKATLIYRRTKNLRAVQLLLGHSKLESTDRYLGIEVNDALENGGADGGLALRGRSAEGSLTGQKRSLAELPQVSQSRTSK
jgi:integrase